MRQLFAVMMAVALIAAYPTVGARAQTQGGLATFAKSTITIRSGENEHRFSVELAKTPKQQQQGLMFRRQMARDSGMLFVYGRPVDSAMWMRNTLLPLDMLFIRKGGVIGKIAERTVPMSEEIISSDGRVIAVLELNAGTAARLGIKPGDRVSSPALPGTAD